ncbi:MAG: energy-coupling factor transporter transmembrane protein EcfT [Actinomycetales bacterium]|nr:energy-coupling factor transporter transmembrane protein EcfT [Actinomycetales bacterium]
MYQPGTSPVHRVGAGPKLAILAVLGIALVVWPRWWVAVVGLVIVLAVALVARVRWRALARGLAPLAVLLIGIAAFQTWQRGWEVAVQVSVSLFALVLAGTVLTATTPGDRLVDLLVRGARPLARIGLKPEVFALAVSLMLRTIPALGEVFAEARDAARARGLEREPRAVLVPTAVRTVARAHAVGEALAARGLGE